MLIKTELRRAGFFPAGVADHVIYPGRNGRIAACQPYRFPAAAREIPTGERAVVASDRQAYLSARLSMSQVLSAMGATGNNQTEENKAVITSPGLAPAEVERSFSLAGPEFAADFARLSNIIFCPLILRVDNGNNFWVPGFELGMFGLEPAAQKAFLSGAMYLGDPARMVFVSTFSAEKLPIPGEELHWNLSYLVGRVRVNALAVAKGLSVQDFGESARDCYAEIYQIRLTQNLLEQTLAADPNFNTTEKFIFILKYLISFDRMVGKAAGLMTQVEKQQLASFAGGEGLDTIRSYNRAFVEAMLGPAVGEQTAS
ncbi:MAG: hypothetical protein KKC80_04565 [Candidatus Margulisbacteria bacterium]|nr:hypothetical protein [Candidatus Margulisiibacteriota bacterium]MBU1616186.1 hypothetical protein [Candidatus Margulisiibacteriota bacterium]MBU1866892.1 hypothetical protein [Candidatus Margulisiibacteriota bacterium]